MMRRLLLPVLLLSTVSAEALEAAEPAKDAPAATAQSAPAQAPAPGEAGAAAPDATKRVVYIPEIVKAEIREEIKQEVLEQAKKENWAAPNSSPEWLKRFKPNGDVRARFERVIFGRGNANEGEFPDFNAINSGRPFDVKGVDLSNDRFLNVDQNRSRPRLRARLGVDVDIGGGLLAGLRLASGESSSPVSANQTLGGSGGDFSRYQFWIDRAFLRWEILGGDRRGLAVEIDRFENPFFATELIWGTEVNFDGIAVQGRTRMGSSLTPFIVAGAFPIFVTAFNFPAERTDKFVSRNKWLYAAQIGADWKASEAMSLKIGAAFYDFDKVEGQTSGPCDTNLTFISCNTDESRPSFAQKGNTYFALRTPSPLALQLEGWGAPQYQFFGLASRFRELVATARLDARLSAALAFGAEAEYV